MITSEIPLFTTAEKQFALSVTLPEVEQEISENYRLLASLRRFDPRRPANLLRLGALRATRNSLTPNKDDLDKSITHLTEAVLFRFHKRHDVVHMLFQLANVLYLRSILYEQPEDIKYTVKYYRLLRVSFRPLQIEASNIPHGLLTLQLIRALAMDLVSEPWDKIQDLEEMAALIHELFSLDISMSQLNDPIIAFSRAITHAFNPEKVKLPAEHVIQVLRKAETFIPDSQVSYALALGLTQRFLNAHVINDYDDAIAIADKIVASHSPGDSLTLVQRLAAQLIQVLVGSRVNSYSSPEYLEDAIHRLRALLSLPSLPDRNRTSFAQTLDAYVQRRSYYFGITGNPPPPRIYFFSQSEALDQTGSVQYGPVPQMMEKAARLEEILTTIQNGEITDVEAAVERSRTILPLHSSDRLSYHPASVFADIFLEAHHRTKRLEYLNEAIVAYRDLRKLWAPKRVKFQAGSRLVDALFSRGNMLRPSQDFEEAMQLFHEIANDESGEVFTRFEASCHWAREARVYAHPSISTAYETAMSLMQETLVFSPTLQIQHFRLASELAKVGALPSDYASYLIKTGQIKQAIVTLERGRALLWSEMRGLRTSTDQLRAADSVLAERFTAINRRLESVTMSVAQSESEEVGDGGTGTGTGLPEEMNLVGRLVSTQRTLLEERESLISHIRSFPGFEGFLKTPSFDVLNSAAAHGPVIIINQSQFRSYILLLLKDSPPSIIFTPSNLNNRANQLRDQFLRVRKEKGLDSQDYDLTLASVLAELYELVGKLVIERLRQLLIPEKSRVWWCPTDAFCSLPLHAMGPIPSDDRDKVYFMDLYISSYTPTLSALVESRKPSSPPKALEKPSLLLVAQPETLPGARSMP